MRHCLLLLVLLVSVNTGYAWKGSGTDGSPYLIGSVEDWKSLGETLNREGSVSGKVFRLTADIEIGDCSIGTDESRPFDGTFDGDGHTLTYIAGESGSPADYGCAPFRYVSGATIRHLHTKGKIHTRHQYAGGIVSMVNGDGLSQLYDCSSAMVIHSMQLANDAHGGLVGAVNSGGLTIDNCVSSPYLDIHDNCAVFVGWSNVDISITNSMSSSQRTEYGAPGCCTFARMASSASLTLTGCYYSMQYGTAQGEGVFSREIGVPDGCLAEIITEPDLYYNGVAYWKSGAQIFLSCPEDVAFDHWAAGVDDKGCFIDDPWLRTGTHTVKDVAGNLSFVIATSSPDVPSGNFAVRYGVRYRYLSRSDYHHFISREDCARKGWYLKDDGYLYVRDGEGTEYYVTAVVGYEPGGINHTLGGKWIWSDDQFTGTLVPVDLMGSFTSHTHLGIIAPRAFKGSADLRRLVFISDIDEDQLHHNDLGVDLEIGHEAFADCPNLESVVMMYKNYTGEDHWDVVHPGQVHSIADDVFAGSPGAHFLVDPSVYQAYLGSDIWKAYQRCIGLYLPVETDMKVDGAIYSYMRDNQSAAIKNNAEGHESLMQTLRYWNADYKNFSSSSLLAEQDNKNIWYAQVTGADSDYLKNHDGVMRIYNDPGSYYNYKTLAIGTNAFSGCKDLRAIEFWQTNGRSENSFTDLKMVIQNGALAHCDSLKELRMYYYCQDGDDHWEILGPKDVIPGENIFDVPSEEEMALMSEEEYKSCSKYPADFRIIVSPRLYQEFIDDPNWCKYAAFIVAADYEPTTWDPVELNGLVYDYAAKTPNIASTNQVVTQNMSWWNLPIKIYEAASLYFLLQSMGEVAINIGEAIQKYFLRKTDGVWDLAASAGGRMQQWTQEMQFINQVSNKDPEAIRTVLETGIGKYFDRQGQYTADLVNLGIQSNTDNWRFAANAFDVIMNNDAARNTLVKAMTCFSNKMCSGNIRVIYEMYKKAMADFIDNSFLDELAQSALVSLPTLIDQHFSIYQSTLGEMTEEQLQRGLIENIKANMHNIAYENTIIYTPDKKLIYHMYVKKPSQDQDSITIYNDIGNAWNFRTVAIAKDAFRGNKKLRSVGFAETFDDASKSYTPMLLAIPDSAFADCSNLKCFSLIYKTTNGGYRALGPENFVLGGDSIFAGCDTTQLRIVVASERRDDFLKSESWKPYARYFTYVDVPERQEYSEYGVNYAYVYDHNTTQRVSKIGGHKIEHLMAISANDKFLKEHQGSMGFYNDIGSYNNYKLDQVKTNAFRGNENLRAVSFWDVNGGDAYTDLELQLGDSCFVDCRNLVNIDMLYCVTDGDDHIDPLKPSQIRPGRGMFEGTSARIKMLPQQVRWFEADTAWVHYRDRFAPCIIQPKDKGVMNALEEMCYYTPCSSPYRWKEYIDLMRIAGAGFQWLDGKFTKQRNELRSFTDFQQFESVGLDYVGASWFEDCNLLSSIALPSTTRVIRSRAFKGCSALTSIDLPAALSEIQADAFAGCTSLTRIIVHASEPPTLSGTPFEKTAGLRIYVPDNLISTYVEAWPAYADYIVDMSSYTRMKKVTLTQAGTLADKLGLRVEWSYSGIWAGDEPYRLLGNFAVYDSLTISGPLNDLDLAVIRYLAGTDSYHNDGGDPTDGHLRYLNLYDASIVHDSQCKAHYMNYGTTTSISWLSIKKDNELPPFLFYKCSSLETIILPRSITHIGPCAFTQCVNLRRLAFAGTIVSYDNHDYRNGLLDYPLEELAMATDAPAHSDCKDPWGADILKVWTKKSQAGDYMGQNFLTIHARSLNSPFSDDAVIETLNSKGLFFPGEYMQRESVEGLFSDNSTIRRFEEFCNFTKVKVLDKTFQNCSTLQVIMIPASVESIGEMAFNGCVSLDTIRISIDSVPELAPHAFASLPSHFRILVPKRLCKLYREKWSEYADHIEVYSPTFNNGIIEVTVTEPNTLDKALGLQMDFQYDWTFRATMPRGIKGDYSHIRQLKVRGPISGGDLALLRHLAGYTPWNDSRNYLGHLEYIDLYDALLVASNYETAPDKLTVQATIFNTDKDADPHLVEDNTLTKYAFLKCYSLKTLILPRSCTNVYTRAIQGCENLETLVVGDDMEVFNWSALDDCASINRLYLLCFKKPKLNMDSWIWRTLFYEYNPTFDAFYVRPSLCQEYVNDPNYSGSSLQRTNEISSGLFNDDVTFCSFAAHAAATRDDLSRVTNVEGWFHSHEGLRDLSMLRYTLIDSLSRATIGPITELERIALPATFNAMEDSLFNNASKLRYVDMLLCDSAATVDNLKSQGLKRLGIDTQRTLVYVPAAYGQTDETNVVVASGEDDAGLHAKSFRLVDSLDYCVPYAFETKRVENTRSLPISSVPYTVCLPYRIKVPTYSRAYRLSSRDGNTLTFTEVKGELEALRPYLLKSVGSKRYNKDVVFLDTDISQLIPSSGGATVAGQDDAPGYTLRGTLYEIGNRMAADMGAYVLQSDGDWHPVSDKSDEDRLAMVPAFRAYLLPSARGAKVGMRLIDDDATGIDTIRTIDDDGTERYYDLMGRQLEGKPRQGVYIYQGKKYVNKR